VAMLNFVEHILKEIRKLREDTQVFLVNGSVQNMERYRFLIGRLEALTMVEELVKKEIKQWQAEDF
jgi:sRNA-binding regulator protein Hfq